MTPPVLALPQMPVEAGILRVSSEVRERLVVLVEEFVAAHEVSVVASERARMADSVVLDDEAERLYDEAKDAWGLVTREASASGASVPDDVLNLGWEYWTARPKVSMPAPAAAGDWRKSVAAVDWFRSRS